MLVLATIAVLFAQTAKPAPCYLSHPTPYIISRSETTIKLRVNVHCKTGFVLKTISPISGLPERQLLWRDYPTDGPVEIDVTTWEFETRSIRVFALR